MNEVSDTTTRDPASADHPATQGQHERYPGPRSFADTDVDRRLFFGREKEIEELVHLVRANRLLVVFGKSGLGKTSLLQAGLFPRLRERDMLPVPVRLDQPGIKPVEAVFAALQATCQEQGVEPHETGNKTGLWEFFKTTDLWRGETLLTPVIVFDQFEELFTLQSSEAQTELAEALGELASRGVPARIRQGLRAGDHVQFSDTPPEMKIIVSLREEYVGTLEQLVPGVPAIFERRFRLNPLTSDVAQSAVVEPAALVGPALFTTKPFSYAEATLQSMMEFLVNRQGEVEPFQLQIVCRHVEQQVANRQSQSDLPVEVDDGLLGGRKAMEALLGNFFRSAVGRLPAWSLSRQRSRARRLCEQGLLSPNGNRVSIEEGQIIKQYKVRERSLKVLTENRLIRKDTRPGLQGFYWELSHDSLIAPVQRSRRARQTGKRVAIAIFALLAILSVAWSYRLLYHERSVADSSQQAYLATVRDLLKRGGLLEPEMIKLSGGRYLMGSPANSGDKDEQPEHEVEIKPFAMGRYEVTFEEYDQFVAETERRLPEDSGWGRSRRPVINVSWNDAQEYAKWLSDKTKKRYRLPTEAEWEYAARSGAKQETWSGTSNEKELGDFGWFGGGKTQEVGKKKANGFGIHDLSGNVWEWVEDCWHENYNGAPTNGRAWKEENGGDCGPRVLRGGSWFYAPGALRASYRDRDGRRRPQRRHRFPSRPGLKLTLCPLFFYPLRQSRSKKFCQQIATHHATKRSSSCSVLPRADALVGAAARQAAA